MTAINLIFEVTDLFSTCKKLFNKDGDNNEEYIVQMKIEDKLYEDKVSFIVK